MFEENNQSESCQRKRQGVSLAVLSMMLALLFIQSLVLLAPALPAWAQNDHLEWQHDLHRALDMARSSQKLVLVDMYTDWCGWCHKLDEETYTDEDVIRYVNSRFVTLRLNAEDGMEGQTLARQIHVRGYPCTIILDSDGHVRGTIYGYMGPQEFSNKLKQSVGS